MNGTENSGPQPDRDALGALFRHVPMRPQPPAADATAIREAVHAEWRRAVGRRAFTSRHFAWSAAASITLAAVVWTWWDGGDRPIGSAPLAWVERSSGSAPAMAAEAANEHFLDARSALHAGQAVSTPAGSRLVLRWHNGVQLRMDSNSRVELISSTALRLADGRIYLDTGLAPAGAVLELEVPHGTIRHLGTQYQVRVGPGITELLVREGRIEFVRPPAADPGPAVATAGQRMSAPAGGEVSIAPVPTWGEAWDWVDAVAPEYEADGKTVADLLGWAARETGRTLSYASPEVRAQAGRVVLRGALSLKPVEALSVVAGTTDFVARTEAGHIEVSLSQ